MKSDETLPARGKINCADRELNPHGGRWWGKEDKRASRKAITSWKEYRKEQYR